LKFKFDLNSNYFVIYKTVLKKKKKFLFEFGFWAETSAWPSRPPHARVACMTQSAGAAAQRFLGAHLVAEPNCNTPIFEKNRTL
jgi:hypothetical protein